MENEIYIYRKEYYTLIVEIVDILGTLAACTVLHDTDKREGYLTLRTGQIVIISLDDLEKIERDELPIYLLS